MSVIKINKYSVKKVKRVGRGIGSGRGGFSGRGAKGQKARSGGSIRPRFEGGQMPLYRRLPKRGFKPFSRLVYNIININTLGVFAENSEITISVLKEKGLIKDNSLPVKLLADGKLEVKGLKITVNKCSKAAKEKIETLGGSVVLV